MIKLNKHDKWYKLDNAAKIFPPTTTTYDPKIFRFSCLLKEKVNKEIIKKAVKEEDASVLVISAQIESEIAQLDSYEERSMFLEDLGLKESGVNKLIRAAYKLLNLATYFTCGVKEVRAWTIEKGFTAPEAAGVIHSDFEKGFIRAEVISYDDFVSYGSESAARDAGKLRVEGKTYVVEDGDVMHFRFNV